MVWADQVAVIRSGLPKVTDGLCQESENAPSLLEVGDRRGLAVERCQEFGMKRVVLDDLSLILGAGRPLGQTGTLLERVGGGADRRDGTHSHAPWPRLVYTSSRTTA